MDSTSPDPPSPRWWGPVSLAEEPVRRLRVGPLRLRLQRRPHEVELAFSSDVDVLDETISHDEDPDEDAEVLRFSTASTGLRLVPRLADRPVVVRPELPLRVLPGEEAPVLLSTPLWLRVETDDGRLLHEFPMSRPSDTWFGPSTLEGELCYAGRTRARPLEALTAGPPARARTRLFLRNLESAPLEVSRIALPVRRLALFAGAHGGLWTEDVVVVRQTEGEGAIEVEVRDGPPEGLVGPEPVAEPREPRRIRIVRRALSAFLG